MREEIEDVKYKSELLRLNDLLDIIRSKSGERKVFKAEVK